MTCNWQQPTLDEAPLQIIDGDRGRAYPNHEDFSSSGFCLFLNANNVTTSGFDFSECQFITEEKDEDLRKGQLARNDVVLTTRGTLGNTAFFGDGVPYDHIRINSGMVIMRSNHTMLLPAFLYCFLRSPEFSSQVEQLRSGVAQPQLPIRDIRRIKLPIPPITVQQRIVDVLLAYDDLIENNRRRIALLEEAARQLYREWFARLRFPGYEHTPITNGVPEGWERQRIEEIAYCVGGGTPSTGVSSYWEDGDITWVTPTDVTRNKHLVLLDSEKKITPAGLQNSSARLVPPHAVLMTSRASVGFFAIAGREVCTNQGFISIVAHDPAVSSYLLFHLSSRVEEIRAMGSGSTYPEVSRGKFREFQVLHPPRSLVLEFNDFVTPLLNQIRILKQQNEKLRTARDLLLPRLMNGEIPVSATMNRKAASA